MKKHLLVFFSLILFFTAANAQKKYQGLLWEISGNGLTKPSYLYGTMHVSSKLAFHLGDSFFVALNNSDMVALELNPDTWVDDMLAYDPYAFWGDGMFYSGRGANDGKEKQRREAIMDALSRDPSLINYYLYRSQGYTGNFEENTYLDLYIFQAGKKLKKEVGGLEIMAETMMLTDEAQRLQREEYKYKKDKRNPYSYDEEYVSFEEMLENSYRAGDLDAIDSLNAVDGTPGYLEYMLYKRNQNMADRMDSIIRVAKRSLFAGMGAAHLPGEKGVIEMLRQKGYTLRAVTRGERDPKQKEKIDEMVIQRKFITQKSFDNYFEVDLPGKMYELTGFGPTRSYFHPDMGNGSYYTVTRIKTFNRDLEQDPAYVLKVVDSLLYENVPGKILKQKKIEKNGYKGFSITTRIAKGDIHRYEILIAPDEIFVFKLGGMGEFAKGKEADKFFNSIKLNIPVKTDWKDFTTPDGMFTVQMPHAPLFYGDTSLMGIFYSSEPFTAVDFNNGNLYTVHKEYAYVGVSLLKSDSLVVAKRVFENGEQKYYDVLEQSQSAEGDLLFTDVRYRVDENYNMRVRYFLRNGYFYTLSVKYNKDSADAERFVRSIKFAARPSFTYALHDDTVMHFTVTTAVQKEDMEKLIKKFNNYKEKEKPYRTLRESRAFIESTKSENVVTVTYFRYGKYVRFKDSATYWQDIEDAYNRDSSNIILGKKHYTKNGFDVFEVDYTDTGCTYANKEVTMQRNGVLYEIHSSYKQSEGLSEFSKKFFETFAPKDTVIGVDIFGNNAELIMADLNSADSATRSEAREYLSNVKVKPEHFKKWIVMIDTLQPEQEKYFEYKSQLIEEMWEIKTPENINYLKGLYEKAGDTVTFQLSVLKTLLYMETDESYKTFKDLLINETPLGKEYEINSLFWNIDDSLELAAKLYPDMLKLFTLDEYKERVVNLLAKLIDSSRVALPVYKDFLPTLINEAKNELKRQTAADVEKDDEDGYSYPGYGYNNGSYYLGNLAKILISQYDDKNVKQFYDKLLQMKDNELRTRVAFKLLDNKRAVPDTLWESIAKKHDDRINLYNELEDAKRIALFPAKYTSQDTMTRSLIIRAVTGGYNNKEIDTIVQVSKRYVEFEGEKGYVYLYKYRLEGSETWRLGIVGAQPTDTTKINASTRIFNTGEKVNDKVSIEKQFTVMLKEELLSIALGYEYDFGGDEDYAYDESSEYYEEEGDY